MSSPAPALKLPILAPTLVRLNNDKITPPSPSQILQYFTPDASLLEKVLECPKADNSADEMKLKKTIHPYQAPKGPRNMLRVRKSKMNKHKRTKWRKKFAALIKKVRLRREIKKEKAFRAELLAQIKEAEDFDAEKYVNYVLSTIRSKLRPEKSWETRERIHNLKLLNRTDVELVTPKFDDPVPPFKKK